jgi:phosphatidylethanolamine/phosphatidyl-N-methylethanolamine N-methyltransferase
MSSPNRDDVVKTYGRYAPLYDWLFGAVLEPGRRALTSEVNRLAPRRLLEIGVGTGLTLAGYPAETSVVGVDLSPDMLRQAQRRAHDLPGRDIELLLLDGESLPFEDHSFDCVTLPYVLSVTPQPAKLLAEMRRVCKPDGTLLILNHFSGSRAWWLLERAVRSIADRVGFRSDFSYQENIVSQGLKVRRTYSVNLAGLSKLVICGNER